MDVNDAGGLYSCGTDIEESITLMGENIIPSASLAHLSLLLSLLVSPSCLCLFISLFFALRDPLESATQERALDLAYYVEPGFTANM